MINYRLAQAKDLAAVEKIVEDAKAFLRANDVPQWQAGYPNHDSLKADIEHQQLYVLTADEQVMGLFAVVENDPNYDQIEGGEWLNQSPTYLAIHRIAVSSEARGKGLTRVLFAAAREIALSKGKNHCGLTLIA